MNTYLLLMEKETMVLDKQVVQSLTGSGLKDYMQYIQSPWKIIWTNMLAGIMRGFGFILGVTVVLALFIWILSQLVELPVIGEYFEQTQEYIDEYTQNTNYKEEFQNIEQLLRELNVKLTR